MEYPEINCTDPELSMGASILLAGLNSVLQIANADAESQAKGHDAHKSMAAGMDYSMCGISFAAAHVSIEVMMHIEKHDGYKCARDLVVAYAGVFERIMEATITDMCLAAGKKDPFGEDVEPSTNQKTFDEIIADIKELDRDH